jgi:broad specificity phosphatase PhoE
MSKPIGYTITLLRTGGTSWDEEARLVGQTDLPMTDKGNDEVARAVSAYAFEPPFHSILSSDEEASVSTARLLPRSSDTKVKMISEFNNIGLGLWEGVLASDLQERSPTIYAQWQEHPERIAPPEGESLIDAQDRLLNAVEKALSKCKGTRPNVAVVLRPLAWAVVHSWLAGTKLSAIWEDLDQSIEIERFEITKSMLTDRKQSSRASA